MRMMKKGSLIIFTLLLGSLWITGCGGDSNSSGSEGSDSTEASVSDDQAGGNGMSEEEIAETVDSPEAQKVKSEYLDVYETFVLTLEGINTKEDLEAADAKIKSVFEEMTAIVKEHKDDGTMFARTIEPRVEALNRRMQEHAMKLQRESPEVMMALSAKIAEYGRELGELMGMTVPQGGQGMPEGAGRSN